MPITANTSTTNTVVSKTLHSVLHMMPWHLITPVAIALAGAAVVGILAFVGFAVVKLRRNLHNI
jgi:uncharacterized integral membrane protein